MASALFGLEGVPSGNVVSPLHPENYTGERNANEREAEKKTLLNFTGILGFKERRQKELTANGEKRKLDESQARKGIRRMPRRSEAKKDAASCEKPWGAAGRL